MGLPQGYSVSKLPFFDRPKASNDIETILNAHDSLGC
jgi:hypothetical protein